MPFLFSNTIIMITIIIIMITIIIMMMMMVMMIIKMRELMGLWEHWIKGKAGASSPCFVADSYDIIQISLTLPLIFELLYAPLYQISISITLVHH